MSKMSRKETISMLKQIGRHECIWMVCRHNEVYETIDNAIKALKEQRPNGEWIYHKEWELDGECAFECSKCGMGTDTDYNFCPNCGLPMNEKALEILRKREDEPHGS